VCRTVEISAPIRLPPSRLHGWTISDVGQAVGFGWAMEAYLDQNFSLFMGGHAKNYLTFVAYGRDFGWTRTLPNTVLSGVLVYPLNTAL
jgi:hypothetical protein